LSGLFNLSTSDVRGFLVGNIFKFKKNNQE
jgi:hypothetical protein